MTTCSTACERLLTLFILVDSVVRKALPSSSSSSTSSRERTSTFAAPATNVPRPGASRTSRLPLDGCSRSLICSL